jgi:hypothetical protein
MKRPIVVLLFALAAARCPAQDFLHETFDAYLVGPIITQTGWGATNLLPAITNTQPAQVSSALPCAGANSLIFPYPAPAGKQCVLAMYTNLNATYSLTGGSHPVLRSSFLLHKQSAEQNFAFMMGRDADMITFGTDTNDGTIIVNEFDTGALFVTGRYAEVAVLYNMSNNDVCVQYDGKNIVDWRGTDAPSLTQFVRVAFFRFPDQHAAENLFVDEILIDKPTPDTLAWWRFEAPATNAACDHAGFFRAIQTEGFYPALTLPATTPLYDGIQDRSDSRGRRDFRLGKVQPWTNTPRMDEWTLEAILAATPGAVAAGGNFQLMDWGTALGHNSTNALITATWLRSFQTFSMYLRDSQQSTIDTPYLSNLGHMPADGRWHHVAFVKTGAWLTVYVDYSITTNMALPSTAVGYYEFTANSSNGIGMTLGNGNMSNTNQLLDELRFTSRALKSHEFLQFAQPCLLSVPDFSAINWTFNARTVSGRTYRVQTAGTPDASSWSNHLPDTIATGHQSLFSLPAQTDRIVRVVRP